MDIEKRKYEIYYILANTIFSLQADAIIQQEQDLVKQEREDAVYEFAKKVRNTVYLCYSNLITMADFEDDINNLLKQYGITKEV